MSDRSTAELVDSVLDGTASPAEESRLRDITEQSPAARRELESMQQVFGDLELLRDEPVPDMAEEILAELRRRRERRPEAAIVHFPASRNRRNWFIAGWAAAAVLAVALFLPIVRSRIDDPQAAGAMIGRTPDAAQVTRVSSASGTLTVTARRTGRTISIESDAPAGPLRLRWYDGTLAAGEERKPAAEMTIECSASRCPPVTFHTQSTPVTLTVSRPGGDSLDIVIR